MEFKLVAPIASAAAAAPLGLLQAEKASASARLATMAVMVRMWTPFRRDAKPAPNMNWGTAILQLLWRLKRQCFFNDILSFMILDEKIPTRSG
jgi:hypothetical protein